MTELSNSKQAYNEAVSQRRSASPLLAQNKTVFERKEKKYVLNKRQYEAIISSMRSYMIPDDYGETPIISEYWDTPDRHLINRSIEKPLFKQKIRIRCYGEKNESASSFLELKKKHKGIVYKRRIELPYRDAIKWLQSSPFDRAQYQVPCLEPQEQYRFAQISKEISAVCERYKPLTPSIAISVQRSAWKENVQDDLHNENSNISGQEGLRITFDRMCRYQDLRREETHLNSWYNLLPENYVVMEVKAINAYPLWLSSVLSATYAYSQSFSKCGEAFKKICGHDFI